MNNPSRFATSSGTCQTASPAITPPADIIAPPPCLPPSFSLSLCDFLFLPILESFLFSIHSLLIFSENHSLSLSISLISVCLSLSFFSLSFSGLYYNINKMESICANPLYLSCSSLQSLRLSAV